MAATALYTLAMSPADAFSFTREALQSAGMTIGREAPPTAIDFSLTRKDVETASIDAVMPGRATIAAANEAGKSTVTIVIDPASQFIIYALALGFAALVFGGWFFGGVLWFLLIVAAEAYFFWAIFSKWPSDALAHIHTKMQMSSAVSGGGPVPQHMTTPVYTPPPSAPATPPKANAADVANEIRHLAELRDQGHITAEEFEAKKTELLKRI